jgi:preprotein translocase subunit SecE
MESTKTMEKEATAGFNPTQFIKDSQQELSKVVWPSLQQLIGESLTVILMVSLSAVAIYLVNNLLDFISQKVFQG